jgi:hypothetical protein
MMATRSARISLAACALLFACSQEAPPDPAPEPTPSEAPDRPPPAAELPKPAPPEPASPPKQSPAPSQEPQALAPAPDAAPAPPAISLEELGERIKATPAIGTFSKLALKNDIDDLVDDLRGYHQHHEGDLHDLHQRYEALVLKLLTLLEDDEPELAMALARSRDDIWSRLVNPAEFAKLAT